MTYEVAVVGGGIIGLATTRELLMRFPSLRVANIEKEPAYNRHQTGHNSGVLHSGIYYRPGTLRAQLCVEGQRAIRRYCDDQGVPYRLTGKLIVALRPDELGRLHDLYERGVANGVEGLELLDQQGIIEREPHCRGIRAVWSPTTGIVDFGAVARSFANDARLRGADLFLGRKVTKITRRDGVSVLDSPLGALAARVIITCGGLHADRIARMTGGARDPRIVPFRGDYLVLSPAQSHLVRSNIYPVPDPEFPFLGVHFTPRMDGSVWMGPNAVFAFAREGYRLGTIDLRDVWDAATYPGFRALARRHWRTGAAELYRDVSRRAFVAALQEYVPELRIDDCRPGPSGVRAQAMMPDGSLVDDIVLESTEGALHVRNAASPAATASLAIARHVVDAAHRRFHLDSLVPLPLAARQGSPMAQPPTRHSVETFVEADWLLARLEDPRIRLVDARSTPHGAPGSATPSGAEQYAAGHLPGAIQLDYADQLADPTTPHAARLAPAEIFARVLGEHGIGDEHTIAAYDDGTVPYAARFVWMCRYYGHDAVHVLAGGLPAWAAAGGSLTRDVPAFPQATFTPRPRPHLRASRDEVLAVATGRNNAQLLETQRDATYALRDRDIAGARRLSGSILLEDARGGRVAERAKIDGLIDALGLDRAKRTIVSCGSGVSASGAYLALQENGFTDVAVYDGSWMEWSHDGLPTVPKPNAPRS